MNCHLHAQSPAIGQCKLCDTPICSECLTVVKGNVICPDCMAQILGRAAEYTSSSGQSASSPNTASVNRNAFLTFILSCCSPGVGHLYLGLTRMGIELMALFFGCIFLVMELNTRPFVFIIPILYCYGIFDSLQKRERMMKGMFIDPQSTLLKGVQWEWVNKNWLGWTVIIVGGLILLNKLDFLRYSMNQSGDVIVAFLLVAAGVFIIYKERLTLQRTKQEEKND